MHSAAALLHLSSDVLILGPHIAHSTLRTLSDYSMHADTHTSSSIGLMVFCCRKHMLCPHVVSTRCNHLAQECAGNIHAVTICHSHTLYFSIFSNHVCCNHVQLRGHTGVLTLSCCAGLVAPQLRRGGSPGAAGRTDEVTRCKGPLQDGHKAVSGPRGCASQAACAPLPPFGIISDLCLRRGTPYDS